LTASGVLPGISDATLIVTVAWLELLLADAPATHAASRLVTTTATVAILRVDFIVLLLSYARGRGLVQIVVDLLR
jgi:hypothetical protein